MFFKKGLRLRTALTLGLLIIAAGSYTCWRAYRYAFPYGVRSCYLPCMVMALGQYAEQNEGQFPAGASNPIECLRQLYPSYMIEPRMLAGLSGDRKEVERRIAEGSPLDEEVSSWVYWPGFTLQDDQRIAIIWEEKPGVRFNGRRSDGHAVGFISGSFRQISERKWAEFVQEQTELREAALEQRER